MNEFAIFVTLGLARGRSEAFRAAIDAMVVERTIQRPDLRA